VRFRAPLPGDEKAIPRSAVADVYASIQNDLIYASDLSPIAAQGKPPVALHLLYLEKRICTIKNMTKQLLREN
jgi:hypothetical protein